ncbi:patatin-like phospholipase domain-containing protein 2 [Anableps anableps]
MFDLPTEWNISFAGCGFRSIYYVGALSCILEQVPQLVHGASKFGGASSGCLVAAALAVGIPIEQLCFSILDLAKEARKHTLGVFHPTFGMLQMVRHSLLETLPEDAHLRATERLCVSLTRLAGGGNVLVSKFDTREELVQVLMCSCFFPVYCGFLPPSYHGVHYVDGALSNNMPLFEHRNTITMAPFSGESDICPREGTFNFFEANYGNVSIQVNTGNVHRVCTSFFPPTLEKLAEICHNGYTDVFCFLEEREEARMRKMVQCNGGNPQLKDQTRLNPKDARSLPASIQKVLCGACRHNHDTSSWWSQFTDFLPIKLIVYMLTLLSLFFAKDVTNS